MDEGRAGRRRRSRVLTLSVSGVLVATSLAACGSDRDAEEHRGVCVDERTQQRVDDDRCDDRGGRGGGFGWVYFGGGSRAPGLGQRVSGGTTTAPANAVRGGVPGDGATISRGGLGGGSDSGVGG